MQLLKGEAVARAIRRHQINDSTHWPYGELIEQLHHWSARFDRCFNLGVPTPVIVIERLRINTIAQYRIGRSGIGTRTTITFNARWLPHRTSLDLLATTLHELTHGWEEWRLGRETGGWYHTKAWREKMAEAGIVTDDHGHHLAVVEPFTTYVNQFADRELSLPRIPGSAIQRQPSKQRQMTKWSCGCTIVRCATQLRARCNPPDHPTEPGCGLPFVQA